MSDSDKTPQAPNATSLITGGRRKEWTHGVVNPPVYRASTCVFDSYLHMRERVAAPFDKQLFYGRKGTPTQWSLEEALTDLHQGALSQLYPSGVGALTGAMLAAVSAGDHILIADAAYEPTRLFANGFLKRMGVETSYMPQTATPDQVVGLLQPNTRAILLESPGSLTFEMQDIPGIISAVKAANPRILAIVDNTWATPLYCRPLDLGADMAVEAITKYVGGHSDLMMGSVTANQATARRMQRTASQLGITVSADDAALALRGLRTLGVRLAQHAASALEIATWLQAQPGVARVLYPALPDDPGYAIWQRDYMGATGLFSIILEGGDYPDTAVMVDDMRLFKMGFSWGGYESLILPSDPTECRTATPWVAEGPVLRLHIGLEDIDDLKSDLADGLTRWHAR